MAVRLKCWTLNLCKPMAHRHAVIAPHIGFECCLHFTATTLIEYLIVCLVCLVDMSRSLSAG